MVSSLLVGLRCGVGDLCTLRSAKVGVDEASGCHSAYQAALCFPRLFRDRREVSVRSGVAATNRKRKIECGTRIGEVWLCMLCIRDWLFVEARLVAAISSKQHSCVAVCRSNRWLEHTMGVACFWSSKGRVFFFSFFFSRFWGFPFCRCVVRFQSWTRSRR